MDWLATWFSTFGLIFAIIDPFGYVPLFLGMTARDSEQRRQKMLARACTAAFVVLGVFILIGSHLLDFFGISIAALQISGGLIMLAIGYEMLNASPIAEKLSREEETEAASRNDISFFPLAFPMLSGPASITTVVVLKSQLRGISSYAGLFLSIGLTLLFTYWILRYADRILRLVGVTGLNVLTRIMGLLLCAMAVQFVINGYKAIR